MRKSESMAASFLRSARLPRGARRWQVLASAVALCIPLTLGEFLHYEVCLTFLLAPLIVMAVLSDRTRETALFFACAAAGVISCLYWDYRLPDHQLVRSLLSLTLVLYAISFLFLGRFVLRLGMSRPSMLRLLSAGSALFGIVLVLRILALGEPVQIEPDGYSRLNMKFFGMPVFGTYGVLSLAHLWCMQALLCGTILFGRDEEKRWRIFATVGMGCLLFLIASSNSRSAEFAVVLVGLAIIFYLALNKTARRWGSYALAAFALFAALYAYQPPRESRAIQTVQLLFERMHEEPIAAPVAAQRKYPYARSLTTGRSELISAAIKDVRTTPVLGNGFTGFGHFGNYPVEDAMLNNSSTHIYYLTLFWKGGLLLVVPFFILLLRLLRRGWQQRKQLFFSEEYFAAAAVGLVFFYLAFFWDTLIVPSAGALAYFLVGLLTAPTKAR